MNDRKSGIYQISSFYLVDCSATMMGKAVYGTGKSTYLARN